MVKKLRTSAQLSLTPKASFLSSSGSPATLSGMLEIWTRSERAKVGFPPNLNLKVSFFFFIYGTKTKFCIWNEPSALLDMVTSTKMDMKISTELAFWKLTKVGRKGTGMPA